MDYGDPIHFTFFAVNGTGDGAKSNFTFLVEKETGLCSSAICFLILIIYLTTLIFLCICFSPIFYFAYIWLISVSRALNFARISNNGLFIAFFENGFLSVFAHIFTQMYSQSDSEKLMWFDLVFIYKHTNHVLQAKGLKSSLQQPQCLCLQWYL